MASEEPLREIGGTCPTPEELGHSGWNILHSSAAMFPHKPSSEQREAFSKLLYGWSHVYACSHCAYHMRRYLAKNPPVVTDKFALNRYICEFHNAVNGHVGNPIYDCDPMVVLRRWHPTFPDMEDEPTIEEQIAEQRRLEAEAIVEKQRKREAEEERLSLIGGGPTRRTSEEWREVKSNVGTFASGWSASARASDSPARTETPQQEEKKKWWFFGGSALRSETPNESASPTNNNNNGVSGTPSRGPMANPAQGDSVNKVGESQPVADNETDVSSILKRLKACMVYCPDKDKDKNMKSM